MKKEKIKYSCCGGPTAVGGHQPHCYLYKKNLNEKIIKEFKELYGDDFDGGCRDKYIDFILKALSSQRKEIIEKIEKMKKETIADDNKYPDARWQRENYGSKQYNQAIKEIINLINKT